MRARVFAVHIHSVNHITARSGTPTSRVSKQSLSFGVGEGHTALFTPPPEYP
jgi:hypothetical protein